jgi:uncharacterized membrane protein
LSIFKPLKISKRHIAKSISWRILGSIDTLLFAWLITGDFNEGLSMSGITTVTKLVWYYFHEQFWLKSSVVDSNKRHVIKTFTWRIIGTVDTVLFGWMITGNPFEGLQIGMAETATKLLLYFGHEKLWYRVNFGLDRRNRGKRLKNLKKVRQHK